MQASTDQEKAPFGFREVAASEKHGLVQTLFDGVAQNYDLMNDLMSGGVHRLWKSAMLDWLAPRPGMTLLDVAGGTGDIAFRFQERGGGPVMVCDLTPGMLAVGRDRAIDKGRLTRFAEGGIDWVAGNAEQLPVADRSVDAYTIAFGLRNVTRIDKALAEAFRVLKPGGRFLCLEFSQVVLPVLDKLYDTYSFSVLPALGQYVAKDREAYVYLAESIRTFPPQEDLAARIRAVGFEMVSYRNLSGGIAALHSGWRL
ncbi:class I SAM-dependent methyltransferase [Oceanibaculum pacificum]|uniref:Ubiquinone/menaquinone biosynthesis C-methyltransferase UbiE n=1 Tax=Oceanibaculum pacificum TaxID=580166 RepID=A0A154WHD7_9PROT|nr:class I SAM-dependent methyltransferase [Oceanibaculum pacificum]KZD12895.1 ubiquinone biosynthesis methyltransferase UbiE [Oceanibaculum pacificum]